MKMKLKAIINYKQNYYSKSYGNFILDFTETRNTEQNNIFTYKQNNKKKIICLSQLNFSCYHLSPPPTHTAGTNNTVVILDSGITYATTSHI